MMTKIAIPAVVALLVMAGCRGVLSKVDAVVQTREHASAVYVRDKSHQCAVHGVEPPLKTVGSNGQVEYVSGWTIFHCAEDVVVVINRGDEQP